MKYITVLFVLLTPLFSFSQTLTYSVENFSLLGVKKIENQLVLLSKGDGTSVKITSISSDGEHLWDSDFEVERLGGYSFNKMHIHGNSEVLYVVQQYENHTAIKKYASQSGELIQDYDLSIKTGDENSIWGMSNNDICKMTVKGETLYKSQLLEDETLEDTQAAKAPENYDNENYRVHFVKDGNAFSSTRVLEPNHGSMHLYLNKYNMGTGDTVQKEIEMELAFTSFTYSNSLDKSVYGVVSSPTGFHLVGKLDIAFKNKYPSGKVGDNFIGLWVAKFTDDFELEYFSEMPFQYLDHIVPADVINKPAVIDLKEDDNKGVFINVNALQGVMYGQKYFIYLDHTGNISMAKGGNDAYHFMEYDRMGLRDAGRKNRVRLMNDDWSSYATNVFLFLSPKPEVYSVSANNTMDLNLQDEKFTPDMKAFNFVNFRSNTLYLNYFFKKKGTLHVYVD